MSDERRSRITLTRTELCIALLVSITCMGGAFVFGRLTASSGKIAVEASTQAAVSPTVDELKQMATDLRKEISRASQDLQLAHASLGEAKAREVQLKQMGLQYDGWDVKERQADIDRYQELKAKLEADLREVEIFKRIPSRDR